MGRPDRLAVECGTPWGEELASGRVTPWAGMGGSAASAAAGIGDPCSGRRRDVNVTGRARDPTGRRGAWSVSVEHRARREAAELSRKPAQYKLTTAKYTAAYRVIFALASWGMYTRARANGSSCMYERKFPASAWRSTHAMSSRGAP